MSRARPATADVVSPASSFQDVYGRQYGSMVRLAVTTTGSGALAEEIVQDAFVQLYRNWSTVDHPVPWLRRAVVSGCRSWLRRLRLEQRHATATDPAVTDPDGIAVRDALRLLSARQRAAVFLRYFEDLPEAEIAAALGCRRGTVKSLLARSLFKLEGALRHE